LDAHKPEITNRSIEIGAAQLTTGIRKWERKESRGMEGGERRGEIEAGREEGRGEG
jgi:hypothetical protein